MPEFSKNQRVLLCPGGSDGIGWSKNALVTLTAANIQGMNATPFSVLPAPAATVALAIDHIIFKVMAGSAAFSGGGTVQFQYHASPNTVVHTGTIAASVLTGATSTPTRVALYPGFGSSGLTLEVGTGLDITNNGSAFTGGTGAVVLIYFKYREIALP
jgi:hypothetical protein